MIRTKTASKRDARNERINRLFTEYMALDGSMKSAVVERVAGEVKTSVSTVNRIVKSCTAS